VDCIHYYFEKGGGKPECPEKTLDDRLKKRCHMPEGLTQIRTQVLVTGRIQTTCIGEGLVLIRLIIVHWT